jgi:hypothetical protein
MVVMMRRVAETSKSVIGKMTYRANSKLSNSLRAENANQTDEDPNSSIDKPENGCNIHLVSQDSFTSRAKPSSNGQLSHCSLSFQIFDVSDQDKTKNSIGWRIPVKARNGFKLQVTTTPGFHSLCEWCFLTMWQFSGAPEDPDNETVLAKPSADAVVSAVKGLMNAIRTGDQDTQQDAAHLRIQISEPWRIKWWSESKLMNGK